LPAFKVTKHNKASRSVTYAPRTLQKRSCGSAKEQLLEPEELRDDIEMVDLPPPEDPKINELELKAAALGWEQIRRKLLSTAVEFAGKLCRLC